MKYIRVNKNVTLNDDFLFHIDSPNANSLTAEVFPFTGWAFSPKNEVITIGIERNGLINKQNLNVNRIDVIEHFKNNPLLNPPLNCGFNIDIKISDKIFFYCNSFKVAEITFLTVDTEDACFEILERLNKAHLDNNSAIISPDDILSLDSSPFKYIENNINKLSEAWWIPSNTRETINSFIKNASSLNFGPEIVQSALNKGVIEVASPIHNDTLAYCDCSFYCSPFNYLRFISRDVVFYLIQHFSFCDAIYIPKLGFYHFISVWIDKNKHCEEISTTTLSSKKISGSFNSILAMHTRPYHYNYDIALGLHLLNKKGLLDKIPFIALHEEKSFFLPSKLARKKLNEHLLSHDELLEHLNESGFSILAGYQIIHSAKESNYKEMFAEIDNNLREENKDRFDSELTGDILKSLKECDVNLWFGITSQKRKLINQVEEIARTINIFSELFQKVGVVIDGWTSPFKKTKNDINEINSDMIVASSIHKKLNENNVNFHSIIGLTTQDKLQITKIIDVFLANHGAGSMHIDRMGNRYGVTHNSNVWSAADLAHIHNNSIQLKQSDITDFEPTERAQDYVDYSVSPKVIAQTMLLQYFKSVNNKQDEK